MSRENYGMMNQEIQDDEVTIDLMELFSALWAKKTIIILSAVFMALVAFVRDEDVRDTEVHVSNEAICYGKE